MLNKIVVGIDPSKKKYRAAVSDRDDIQIANAFILLGITSLAGYRDLCIFSWPGYLWFQNVLEWPIFC